MNIKNRGNQVGEAVAGKLRGWGGEGERKKVGAQEERARKR